MACMFHGTYTRVYNTDASCTAYAHVNVCMYVRVWSHTRNMHSTIREDVCLIWATWGHARRTGQLDPCMQSSCGIFVLRFSVAGCLWIGLQSCQHFMRNRGTPHTTAATGTLGSCPRVSLLPDTAPYHIPHVSLFYILPLVPWGALLGLMVTTHTQKVGEGTAP